MGTIDGEWVTVSNSADEPISGSQFDFQYSFDPQDRYDLSGTFNSATSASVKLVIFSGFRFTETNVLQEDKTFQGVATRGE